jgi:hypothetical protein
MVSVVFFVCDIELEVMKTVAESKEGVKQD